MPPKRYVYVDVDVYVYVSVSVYVYVHVYVYVTDCKEFVDLLVFVPHISLVNFLSHDSIRRKPSLAAIPVPEHVSFSDEGHFAWMLESFEICQSSCQYLIFLPFGLDPKGLIEIVLIKA